jgi:hypothetical protein
LDIELDLTLDQDPRLDDSNNQLNTTSEDDDEPEDRVPMPGGLSPLKNVQRRLPGRISPQDLPLVQDLILPHVPRWRVFKLMVNNFQIMYGILSTLSSIPLAPQLQVLRLYHYDDDEDYDHFSPSHLKQLFAPFSGRAPGLMQAALWGFHVDWDTCTFLQGLEELSLSHNTGSYKTL